MKPFSSYLTKHDTLRFIRTHSLKNSFLTETIPFSNLIRFQGFIFFVYSKLI